MISKDALANRLREALSTAADPERAEGMRAYMKSEMPFLGVPMSEMRRISKRVFSTHPIADEATFVADVLGLWDGARFREERYAAIELTGDRRARPLQTARLLPMYRHMIVTGAWWDLVDAIAPKRLGPLLDVERAPMTKAMRRWAIDDDLWVRRSAILAQLHRREGTDLALLHACLAPSFGSREFFLAKAIGWALRQHAYTDAEWVRAYLEEHGASMQRLSVREAKKHL